MGRPFVLEHILASGAFGRGSLASAAREVCEQDGDAAAPMDLAQQ